HPRAHAVALAHDRDRVVEILRGVGVDREGRQLAEIGAPLGGHRWRLERLELLPCATVEEQPLEHALDLIGRPEHALDLRAAAAARDDGELSALGTPERL